MDRYAVLTCLVQGLAYEVKDMKTKEVICYCQKKSNADSIALLMNFSTAYYAANGKAAVPICIEAGKTTGITAKGK